MFGTTWPLEMIEPALSLSLFPSPWLPDFPSLYLSACICFLLSVRLLPRPILVMAALTLYSLSYSEPILDSLGPSHSCRLSLGRESDWLSQAPVLVPISLCAQESRSRVI